MGRIEFIAEVELGARSAVRAQRVGRHAVIDQVADRVWREMQFRILVESRHLVVQVAQALLHRQHQEAVHFALVFIELRRWQGGCAGSGVALASQRETWRLVRIVWNLEAAVVGAEHGAQAGIVIEEIRQAAERFVLARLVMQGAARRLRVFHADRVAQVAAGQVIVELAYAAKEFSTRLDVVVAADQDANAAAWGHATFLGFNVDDTGGAQAELGRQGARDEIRVGDQTRIDRLAETGNAFWQLYAIDAVLHVCMVIAHMQRTGTLGVLRYAWQAQQYFIERRVVALAQHIHHMAIDAVDSGTDLR